LVPIGLVLVILVALMTVISIIITIIDFGIIVEQQRGMVLGAVGEEEWT
jgi:hypothetical protein